MKLKQFGAILDSRGHCPPVHQATPMLYEVVDCLLLRIYNTAAEENHIFRLHALK